MQCTTCPNQPEIEIALVVFTSSVCWRKSLKIVTNLGINWSYKQKKFGSLWIKQFKLKVLFGAAFALTTSRTRSRARTGTDTKTEDVPMVESIENHEDRQASAGEQDRLDMIALLDPQSLTTESPLHRHIIWRGMLPNIWTRKEELNLPKMHYYC